MREDQHPRMDMPAVFHFGSLEVPAVYVRLLGVAATILVIWLISLPLT